MDIGDNVKVKENPETIKAGLSGKTGQIYGVTTPSVSNVEVVGSLSKDLALSIRFDDLGQSFWLPEEYVELVDHGADTQISIGDAKFVRDSDGSWGKQ